MDNIMQGWIKLHRKLIKWEWYHDSNMVHLFIHLLLNANHKDSHWQGNLVKRGQMITGRKQLSADTGLSEQTIRTCLKRLKSTNELTIKPTNRFSLITIVNFNTYNNSDMIQTEPINQPANQQLTSNQPATNQQLTTNKNVKKEKNGKNEKKKDKYMDFVFLSKDEHKKLLERFGSVSILKEKITALNDYLGSTGKKYASHYHTILTWARKDDKLAPKKKTPEEKIAELQAKGLGKWAE
ncbi:MAG TPA: hypothetical protein ENH82_06135 [bacterium]|nr:hypothetical protein [bacterium]